MKIYPSGSAPGQAAYNRVNEPADLRSLRGGRESAEPEAKDQPVPEIRRQLLVVQRALGRFQSVLGGLEGFKVLLRSDARTADDYIGKVVYRGERVLESHRGSLAGILANKDTDSLQQLIEDTRKEIRGLAVTLSRMETAEQNTRSLAFGEASLSSVLEGIRDRGSQLQNLEGQNVLDLLG
jgi:hypothetical protein